MIGARRTWLMGAMASLVAGCLVSSGTALAEDPGPNGNTVNIGPVTTGPIVTNGLAAYGDGGISATVQATGSSGSHGVGQGGNYYGPTYTYESIPYGQVVHAGPLEASSNGLINVPSGTGQSACPPGQTGYFVYDGNSNYLGVVCVAPPVGGPHPGPRVTPNDLAQQASQSQPWPNLLLSINPDIGLTGLASWFWLGGGSPTMPDATATAGPLTVTVHASFVGTRWDFGDRGQLDSADLGQQYPHPSDVNHTYQSDTGGLPSGYQVTAMVRFDVTYSINGGPWVDLGTKVRAYTTSYVVNQLQPEAVP